jgi:hypothetical protein
VPKQPDGLKPKAIPCGTQLNQQEARWLTEGRKEAIAGDTGTVEGAFNFDSRWARHFASKRLSRLENFAEAMESSRAPNMRCG